MSKRPHLTSSSPVQVDDKIITKPDGDKDAANTSPKDKQNDELKDAIENIGNKEQKARRPH